MHTFSRDIIQEISPSKMNKNAGEFRNELFCQKIDILLDEPSINFRVVTLWSCHVLISAFSFVSEDLRRRENELDVFESRLFYGRGLSKMAKNCIISNFTL